jgi:predicted metal-dependent hydrolase
MTRDPEYIIWPPSYTVKKHPRARHVKLKTSAQHGLEFVVPPSFNHKEIPTILETHKDWIKKQLIKLQKTPLRTEQNLPNHILLKALNHSWKIEYIAGDCKLRLISRPHQELVVLGNIQSKLACRKILTAWIKQQSIAYLTIKLKELSIQTGLPYNKLSIRNQKTRWGSCSREKTISLNYKLLFLPEELVKHIIIHELCHTVHLNHSERFWRLVTKYDPLCEEHRRLLRKEEKIGIPGWVL